MQTEDEMTINERRKYLKRMKPLYAKASKGERGALLTQMQQVTGLHRKSLLRLLAASTLERKPRQKQRESSYGAEVVRVILLVWESLDYICAERLTPVLQPGQRGPDSQQASQPQTAFTAEGTPAG